MSTPISDSAFTEKQLKQLYMAKSYTSKGYEAIKSHPEWSYLAMNFVWNKIARGEEDSLKDFISYLNVSGLDKEGKLGGDLLFAYSTIANIKGDERNQLIGNPINIAIAYLTRHPDCSDKTELLYNVLKRCFILRETTDRVKLSQCIESNSDLCTALMSEAVPEAKVIYESMMLESTNLNPMKLSPLYALDDMNIRGKQIVYAYEYCDSSLSDFINSVYNRDGKMIGYVNYKIKSNGDYIKGKRKTVPKAVHGEASFTGGIGFEKPKPCIIMPYEEYTPVEKKTISYSTREITQSTSESEGIRILKSLGFEPVYMKNQVDIHGKPVTDIGNNTPTTYYILHNPETGAICNISAVLPNHLLYGGMDIMVPYKGNSFISSFLSSVEMNRIDSNKEYSVGRINGGENPVSTYKSFIEQVDCVNDTTILGYNGHNGIPIPDYYDFAGDDAGHDYVHANVENMCGNCNSVWSFARILNCLSIDTLVSKMPEEKQFIYKPFLADRYKWSVNYCYMTLNPESSAVYLGTASLMLGVPKSELDKYAEVMKQEAERYINRDSLLKYLNSKSFLENLYGTSKLVEDFIDEFNIKVKFSPIDDKNKKRALKLLTKALFPIIDACSKSTITGNVSFKENNGNIYLSAYGTLVVYFKNGNMHVSGKATAVTEEQWKTIIKKAILRIQKVLNKPVKEVRFSLNSGEDFKDISICPHSEEPTSYLIQLS